MKRNIKLLLILMLILLSINVITVFSADTDYTTVINEMVQSKNEAIYNIDLNAPFSKDTSGVSEVINPFVCFFSCRYVSLEFERKIQNKKSKHFCLLFIGGEGEIRTLAPR